MVPWSNFSIHKNLLDELESTNTVGELKQIGRTLIKENKILCHKIKTALKTVQNQRTLIKYLQQTFAYTMAKNIQQSKELWAVLASETLRTYDSMIRYQMLIFNLAEHNKFEVNEREKLKELCDAVTTVPFKYVKVGRAKCVHFLAKLKGEAPQGNFDKNKNADNEENVETQNAAQKKKVGSIKFQNGKVNSFRGNRKQHYRIMAKRNACNTSRKHSFNKSQNNKSESSRKKNAGETSQSDTEDVQSMKFSRRRRLKRKAEMIDESCLKSGNENSASIDETPMIQTEPTKKIKNNDSISIPTNESYEIKELEIKVSDFMNDTSADNDPCIALFKQACNSKANECNSKMNEEEFQILDDVDDDVDDDQKAESDIDNNDEHENQDDDDNSFKSPESEDDNNIEEDSTVIQSTAASSEERPEPTNTTPNERKGPCTPPQSPTPAPATPAPVDSVRKEPCTPSHSPPGPRRGPCTPPGLAPTSDSEGSNQGESTLDIISEEVAEFQVE